MEPPRNLTHYTSTLSAVDLIRDSSLMIDISFNDNYIASPSCLGISAPLPESDRYTSIAIALHWIIAFLVIGGFALGWWMVDLPLIEKARGPWYPVHKWIGITVFVLALARLAWRATHPAPPLPLSMPVWERHAAQFNHWLLYGLLLAIPLSGWFFSSASGVSVKYLNLIPLPDLIEKDRDLAKSLKTAHLALNYALAVLVVVHIAAALKHHFIDRDTVLSRMLPVRRGSMNSMFHLWFIPLLLLPALSLAQGVQLDKSEIRFVTKQMGVNVEGKFRKFKANVVFNPNDPAASKAEIEIDLNSIDLASEEAETEAKRKSWFNTAVFPTAKFTSTAIKNTGPDRYEVVGKLNIKGSTQDIVFPVTIKRDASGNQVAEGSFTIKRLTYKIGEGPWADTETVADDILVRGRVVMTPAAKK